MDAVLKVFQTAGPETKAAGKAVQQIAGKAVQQIAGRTSSSQDPDSGIADTEFMDIMGSLLSVPADQLPERLKQLQSIIPERLKQLQSIIPEQLKQLQSIIPEQLKQLQSIIPERQDFGLQSWTVDSANSGSNPQEMLNLLLQTVSNRATHQDPGANDLIQPQIRLPDTAAVNPAGLEINPVRPDQHQQTGPGPFEQKAADTDVINAQMMKNTLVETANSEKTQMLQSKDPAHAKPAAVLENPSAKVAGQGQNGALNSQAPLLGKAGNENVSQHVSLLVDADKTANKNTKQQSDQTDKKNTALETANFRQRPVQAQTGKDALADQSLMSKNVKKLKADNEQFHKPVEFTENEQHVQGGKNIQNQEFARDTIHQMIQSRISDSGTHRQPASAPAEQTPQPEPFTKDLQSDVMRQVVKRMTLKTHGLQPQMLIKLKPEFLGDLNIQVTAAKQQVMVKVTADSHVVKEMIEQNLQILKTELSQHGLEIDKFDVFVGNDNNSLKQQQQQHLRRAKNNRNGKPDRVEPDAEQETSASLHPAQTLPKVGQQFGEVDFFA
ncbi:MAG: hypothetical protein GY874_21575 [Desulfobacteraceae bacterium]|nr:hypothetical protein [Desulfobacteraceae bacterium]